MMNEIGRYICYHNIIFILALTFDSIFLMLINYKQLWFKQAVWRGVQNNLTIKKSLCQNNEEVGNT